MEPNEKQAEMMRQDALVSGRLIAKYLPEEIRPLIREIIKQAYIDAGFLTAVADGRLDDMATNQASDLKRFHYDLTIEEVKEGCLLGALKMLGDYTGISRVTINDWLNKYRNLPARQNALTRMHLKKKESYKVPERTAEQIKQDQAKIVEQTIQNYKSMGFVMNGGNATYNYFVSSGLIPEDDYKQYLAEAKELQIAELVEAKQSTMDRHRIRQITEELEAIRNEQGETDYMKRIAGTKSVIEWIKKQPK